MRVAKVQLQKTVDREVTETMDKDELVEWMETHDIAETLRCYVINNLKGEKQYEPLADLATKGEAVVKIKLKEPEPHIHCISFEAFEESTPTETLEIAADTVEEAAKKVVRKKKG